MLKETQKNRKGNEIIKVDESSSIVYLMIHSTNEDSVKNNTSLLFKIKIYLLNYPFCKPKCEYYDSNLDNAIIKRMQTKFNEIVTKIKNGVAIDDSINSNKRAKETMSGLKNNILEKQANEMLNNTRLLKDDLNAM